MTRSSLWTHRSFLKFWGSQSISLLGLQIGMLAFPLTAVLALNASPAQIGIMAALGAAPWIVLGPFIGPAIDRLPARLTVVACHLGRAVLVAAIPVAAVSGWLSMPLLYGFALATGVLSMTFEVAYHVLLPELVDRAALEEGNSKLAVTDGAARAAGPAVAGLVIQHVTAPMALWGQSVTFLIAGFLMWSTRTAPRSAPRSAPRCGAAPRPGPGATAATSAIRDLREGFVYTFGQPSVRILVLADSGYLFFYDLSYAAVLVFYSRQLHLDPATIGLVFAVGSVGGILAGLVARPLLQRLSTRPGLAGSAALRAIGLALIPVAALVPALAVPVLCLARFANASGWTLWEVRRWTTQQQTVPLTMAGRAAATSLFTAHSAEVLGSLTGAAVAATLGLAATLTIGGAGALLAVAILTLSAIPRAEC